MVAQGSKRTLAQATKPQDPARTFNERGQGIMRKLHTYKESLSSFGVEVGLLIRTPYVEFVYETQDNMIRDFNADVAENNRYRPQDVEGYFRGRVLRCPSILSMSPQPSASGRSSPSLSSASSTSLPAADAVQNQGTAKKPNGLGLFPGDESDNTIMGLSSLLNPNDWPSSPFAGDAQLAEGPHHTSPFSSPLAFGDAPHLTPPPAMSRPCRPWTPVCRDSLSSPSPKASPAYRVFKIRTSGRPRRNFGS